jgi:hypothetical protein
VKDSVKGTGCLEHIFSMTMEAVEGDMLLIREEGPKLHGSPRSSGAASAPTGEALWSLSSFVISASCDEVIDVVDYLFRYSFLL